MNKLKGHIFRVVRCFILLYAAFLIKNDSRIFLSLPSNKEN
ncbi:MAG: hypothetical protein ACFFAS_15255 [Promethearchaeota archaeon]